MDPQEPDLTIDQEGHLDLLEADLDWLSERQKHWSVADHLRWLNTLQLLSLVVEGKPYLQ